LKLVSELKERRFVPLLTGYLAAGWVVLEVTDQLTGNEILPELFYPIALTLLVCGIPAVAVVAWFHGAKGEQKPPPREIAMLGGLAVIALAVTAYVVRAQLVEPEDASASALDRLDPTEDPRRIAVMYFDAAGSGNEADLLATGLTEALIDELSRIPAVHVVSRNGVAPLKGRSTIPTDSVRKALQVGTFVQGTVTESDSVVRVRVRVVNAATDRSVGSGTFERPRSELFQLQDEIAGQVALFLRETIGEEVRLVSEAAQSRNVDAWVSVQRAAELESEAGRLAALGDTEGTANRLADADSALARAERQAPDWSVPRTRRGWLAYERARRGGFDRTAIPRLLAQGRVHADRALALDPRDADALELRATIDYWRYLLNLTSEPGEAERLLEQAEEDFHAATAADPTQASAYSSLSHLLMNQGRTAQAKLAAEKSFEADPWLLNANSTVLRLFQTSLDLQDEQEARTWCETVGANRFPNDYRFVACRVWLLALPTTTPGTVAAKIDDAWLQCEAVVELSPASLREFNRSHCQMLVAMALVRAALPDSARSVAERARAGPSVDPIRELAWLEAIVLTWLEDHDAAVDRLSLYFAANPGQVEAFARDDTWWLEDLRSVPAYQRLVGSR
jgi:serine/threonine-protein kinase